MCKYRVTKEIRWEAAHRLSQYNGLCSNVHGHSYYAEVVLGSNFLDLNGFVVDFTQVKERTARFIADRWDHAIILYQHDPLLPTIQQLGLRHFVIYSGDPTVERMSEILLHELQVLFSDLLEHGVAVLGVRIWETPTSYATFGDI